MRRFTYLVCILGVLFFITSCSSMDTSRVKKVDKAAVAIVGVEKHINYTDDFEIPQLVQRLAQSDKFDLQPIAENLHENTFGVYTEVMPFTLIPEEEVIETERYKNFELYNEGYEEATDGNSNFITVKNYKKYNPSGMLQGRRAKLFEAMPDEAEAMLMVGLSYKLFQENSMIPGVNKGKIEADLDIRLVKPNGERILTINKKAESDNSMKVVLDAAILDPDKIQPLVQDATDKAMAKAEEFIQDNLSD
ncbi:hypothetical protein LX73_2101 [Fodinibius salinus]|uniref:Lipoprotein n=1 Tax=Fodinibius salinus TaxID=860790 RepID=A0A5D3YHH9_9BACT|nr:hypothetical protein [Fodinibius salinus]TYP92737.1 hypothetical protein LX73_2101 [Fodinibius salinus]